jgi:ABC-type multidrug transport system permease subunit
MFFKRFRALLATRNKEFIRDRSSISWNLVMPIMIVAGFAFMFSGDFNDQYKVGIAGNPAPGSPVEQLKSTRYIEFIEIHDLQSAITRVQRHQLDMLIDADKAYYWINSESPKGYLVEKILVATTPGLFTRQTVSGREIRYVDWVIPGILSMNMMFSALFGVGYVIVRYRKNGMLKRLKATPVTPLEYLASQIVSRLILIMAITAFIFYSTNFFIDYAMYGSHLSLFLVFALGSISMISLGLVVSSRTSSEELAGGLLNLCTWPMMFLSGVWFSLEGTNPVMQQLAEFLPLTHVTAAARAIMIDGASLVDVSYHMFILVIQSIVFLLAGAYAFRWE